MRGSKVAKLEQGIDQEQQTKWVQQAKAVRESLPVGMRQEKPWSRRARLQGISKTARVLELLDIAYLCQKKMLLETDPDVADQKVIEGLVCDTSQAISRRPWGSLCTRTLTTSSQLYSFEKDRLLLPHESLRMLGFQSQNLSSVCKFGISDSDLSDLAGSAMSLPAVTCAALSLIYASAIFDEDGAATLSKKQESPLPLQVMDDPKHKAEASEACSQDSLGV